MSSLAKSLKLATLLNSGSLAAPPPRLPLPLLRHLLLPPPHLPSTLATTTTTNNNTNKQVRVNGIGFSTREPRRATATLVVSLSPKDAVDDVTALGGGGAGDDPPGSVHWHSEIERRAAKMSDGNVGEIFSL